MLIYDTGAAVKVPACFEDLKSWITSAFILNSGKSKAIALSPKLLSNRISAQIIPLGGVSVACSELWEKTWMNL